MHYLIAVCLACGIGLLFQTPVFSQDAGASDTEEGVYFPPYSGLRGQQESRVPHELCSTCFTVPNLGEGYRIFESIPLGNGAEHLLFRRVANPAPLEPGEVRSTADPDGEPLWYIGTQAYSGPQDTEVMPGIGRTIIEVKRIRFRHEPMLLQFPGIHGVSITATGIGVHFLPGSDTSLVPPDIEGIPVEIFFTERPVLQHHHTTRFRPVQTGSGIAVSGQGGGTLGPHITRGPGACCQVWSLTASHVIRSNLDDPVPSPGTVRVYQPTVQDSDLFGYVAYIFRLEPCGTIADDSGCYSLYSPLNRTDEEPDIAAIDGNPYDTTQEPPYNNPTDTDPIRRLTSSATSYINGPSGRIRVADVGHTLKVWGAYGGPQVGTVQEVDRTIFPFAGTDVYRMCCLTSLNVATVGGDSGAVVTYGGTGKRHVAGVHIAGDSQSIAWFIPSDDIQTAFEEADKDFDHYWGTKDGYRTPATTTCDPPGC